MSSTLPPAEDPLLRALAEHWDDVQSLADDEQRAFLQELVNGTAEPDPVSARAALADLLIDLLPPHHPIVPVLRSGIMFQQGSSVIATDELERSWSRLRMLVLPADDSARSPGPEQSLRQTSQSASTSGFDRQVQARLLSLPFLSPDDLRNRHIDPENAGLIRLPRVDGELQLPAFQFTAAGEPWPIVQEVNMLLDAAADPWGVACWWVDPHAGLAGAPADLLGLGRDELVQRAAAAVGMH